MTKVIILPEARDQLSSIAIYTRDNWGYDQAQFYVAQLKKAVKSLGKQPERGVSQTDIAEHVRKVCCDKHVVYYLYENDLVKVFAILHQSMDAVRHINLPSDSAVN